MSTPSNELSLVPIAPTSSLDATASARASPSAAPAVPHARPLGPGWFDSSFDLHRGLDVKEGWSDDARLRVWVDAFLGAQPVSTTVALSNVTPAPDVPTRRD